MKLSGASKAMLRNIVGRCHVGEPIADVLIYVRSRLAKNAPADFVKAALRFAQAQHKRNLREYTRIMRGM